MKLFIILLIASISLNSQSIKLQQDYINKSLSQYSDSNSTYPQPFQEIMNGFWWDDNIPSVSTGYYFISNNVNTETNLRPKFSVFKDTTDDEVIWTKIITGPRQLSQEYWNNNDKGHFYFRNPANDNPNTSQLEYFQHFYDGEIDSTDDAFAGPIALRLKDGFKFNGIKYDSFYVSTNGLIALSNRRYNYTKQGNRTLINGSAYNLESQDKYVRDMSGNGINDPTIDNYGYKYMALGNDKYHTEGGIRKRGNIALNGNSVGDMKTIRSPLIAPLWGDLILSQFSASSNKIDEHGKVYFGISKDSTKLYIYFVNAQIKGNIITPNCEDVEIEKDLRPGDNNYISANFQVILDNVNNDIHYVFRRFNGRLIGTCKLSAQKAFLHNTTSGVRGFARHKSYIRKNREHTDLSGNNILLKNGDEFEYEQYTHQWLNNQNLKDNFLHSNYLVRYRQFKNTIRTVSLQYKVREKINDYLFPTLVFKNNIRDSKVENFELLAGEPRLGAIQPIAIFQNMSTDIQGENGINYTKQELNFKTMLQMRNKASGRIIYQKVVSIDSTCMAIPAERAIECSGDRDVNIRLAYLHKDKSDYYAFKFENPNDRPDSIYHFPGDGTYSPYGKPFSGIPPYGYVYVEFPPWSPSEFISDHIGLIEVSAIAISESIDDEVIEQDWTFDDTLSRRLFVMKRLETFYDNGNEFHLIDGVPQPSVWKWVNKNAEVVSGDLVSKHPMPPQGEVSATYVEDPPEQKWLKEYIKAAKNFKLNSPTIKMNRVTLIGEEPETNPGGDILTSFPINMVGRKGSYLTISIQRTEHRENWDRGWADAKLIGPEPRTIFNNHPFNNFDHPNASSEYPDELVIEYLNMFEDKQINRLVNVTNPDESRWRKHPRRKGAETETEMPAFKLYGAGGYEIGFLEEDPDSALAPPSAPNINSLRFNLYDDGIDDGYKKYWVAIPDTFINMPYNAAENFRFRIRVNAGDDNLYAKHGIKGTIPDDDDDFFIDNVEIFFYNREYTDIEINRHVFNYKEISTPYNHMTRLNNYIEINNLGNVSAPTYYVQTIIKKIGEKDTLFERMDAVGFQLGKTSIRKFMPYINTINLGLGNYMIASKVRIPNDSDFNPLNDSVNTFFKISLNEYGENIINISDNIAYDPQIHPNNDVGDLTGIHGDGLKLPAANINNYYDDLFKWDKINQETGDINTLGNGQIAMKFSMQNADTVRGARCFFSSLNSAPDEISISIYRDYNGIPGQMVPGTRIYRKKGQSDTKFDENGNNLYIFGEYVDYKFDEEIILQPRNYWLVITQLGDSPLNLGASKYRGGMRTMNVYNREGEPLGLGGVNFALNKEWRTYNNLGTQLLNDNHFAVENEVGSNEWIQFMPNVGNPAYAHNNSVGLSPVDNKTFTLSRGFWIPMLRPIFKVDYGLLPVELASFDGVVRNKKIELKWTTESEIDNKGFYIERKLFNEDNSNWNRIAWINGKGKGNHAVRTNYNYTDDKIKFNTLYNYRLHQEDIDGTYDNESSGIVTLQVDYFSDLNIELTSENPFKEYITYVVSIPKDGNLNISITDMLGNEVFSENYESISQGRYNFHWDTTKGSKNISNGTYFLKASINGENVSEKIILIK